MSSLENLKFKEQQIVEERIFKMKLKQEQSQELVQVFQSMEEAICVVDNQQQVLFQNTEFEKLLAQQGSEEGVLDSKFLFEVKKDERREDLASSDILLSLKDVLMMPTEETKEKTFGVKKISEEAGRFKYV